MRCLLYAWLLLVSAVVSAANDTAFVIGRDVRVEITNRILVYEAWNSVRPELVESGDAVAMLYVMDSEAAPSTAGRQLLAIVMVGERGTGIQPVAFRITAPSAREVRLLPVTKDGVDRFDLIVGNDKPIRLEMQSNGRVTLDGRELGAVH